MGIFFKVSTAHFEIPATANTYQYDEEDIMDNWDKNCSILFKKSK
jgi:hypothetical protein